MLQLIEMVFTKLTTSKCLGEVYDWFGVYISGVCLEEAG